MYSIGSTTKGKTTIKGVQIDFKTMKVLVYIWDITKQQVNLKNFYEKKIHDP